MTKVFLLSSLILKYTKYKIGDTRSTINYTFCEPSNCTPLASIVAGFCYTTCILLDLDRKGLWGLYAFLGGCLDQHWLGVGKTWAQQIIWHLIGCWLKHSIAKNQFTSHPNRTLKNSYIVTAVKLPNIPIMWKKLISSCQGYDNNIGGNS